MRCPTLNELPINSQGKTGWPWMEETSQASGTLPDNRPWPKVSIVTASYNQAAFVEKVIRSVLLQGYPNLEYIIMDGGSTDGSVEIIKKYEKYLAGWASEPDRGQSHALNKGIKRATGEIIGYINVDDYYLPGAVQALVGELVAHPEVSMVHGNGRIEDPDGRILRQIRTRDVDAKSILIRNQVFYPTLIKKAVLDRTGIFDETLHFCMDYDLWIRIVTGYKTKHVPAEIIGKTMLPQTKSVLNSDAMMMEAEKVKLNHLSKPENKRLLGNEYVKIQQFCFWNLGWFNYQSLNLREARKWLAQVVLIKPVSVYSLRASVVLLLSLLGKHISKILLLSYHSFLDPTARKLRKFSRYLRVK